jgi:hypothetical protein
MIDWKRVPWSLWLFCAILAAGWVAVEVDAHGPALAKVLFAALMLAWVYFLLRAVRWLWIVTVAISVTGFVPHTFMASRSWRGLVTSVVELALLLLPVTRRYFADGTETAEAGER